MPVGAVESRAQWPVRRPCDPVSLPLPLAGNEPLRELAVQRDCESLLPDSQAIRTRLSDAASAAAAAQARAREKAGGG